MEEPRTRLRRRFWFETALSALLGVLFVVTLFWHDWLEAFGLDPDHGDGSAEWSIVAALALAAIVTAVLARLEWTRTANAPA